MRGCSGDGRRHRKSFDFCTPSSGDGRRQRSAAPAWFSVGGETAWRVIQFEVLDRQTADGRPGRIVFEILFGRRQTAEVGCTRGSFSVGGGVIQFEILIRQTAGQDISYSRFPVRQTTDGRPGRIVFEISSGDGRGAAPAEASA